MQPQMQGRFPPALYGIYTVDELSIDGQVRPLLFTDPTVWRRVVFDLYDFVGIVPPEGPVRRFRGKLDEPAFWN